MTINWKQGLFAAALLLSVSMLFVGCGKCKTDKAVADKSTGEIIGEEVDVIEVVPAQTPNANSNAAGEQNNNAPAAPAQPSGEAPAMTPPATAPADNAPTTQPEPAADSDAAPSSTTSDVTVSTSCNEIALEQDAACNWELEPVIESESAYCCSYCQSEAACCPACDSSLEACQPACDAATTCAPDPVCAPAPVCLPAPACNPCCMPCRHRHIRRCCRPCHDCCRARVRCIRVCLPCCAACDPVCVSDCTSACDPACQSSGCAKEDCAGSWTNEQRAPADSTPKAPQPQTRPNKTTGLPDPKISDATRKANASTSVGSTPTTPEAPSIVLPEAK